MTLKKKWVIAIVAVALIGIVGSAFLFVDFGASYNADEWNLKQDVTFPSTRTGTIPETGRIVLAESARFLMEYSVEDQSVSLTEKGTDVSWSTAVDPETLAQPIQNKQLVNGLRQLVNVTYTDFNILSNIVNSTSQGVVVTETLVENGIRFHLDFQKQSFSFDLVLWLEGEQLVAGIPAESIKETGKYGITAIDVLPMLMNSGQEEGYIVYPYGSGALYHFSPNSTAQSGLLTQSVYGMRVLSPEDYADNLSTGQKAISLPVYGIKAGNASCVALIESGDESSAISLAPRGYIYAFDRVYAGFVLRKTYTYEGPQDTDMTSTEKNFRIGDMSVRFMFPRNENATYSGMAALVQEHLKSVGVFQTTVKEGVSAHLEFLMGATESTLLGDTYLVSSSYDDVREILEDLSEQGVGPTVTSLIGWESNGYGKYPGKLSMASALGGKSTLKELTQFASSQGSKVYITHDFVRATASTGGFSIGREAVCNSAGVTITDETENEYFLNAYTQLTKKLPQLLTLLEDTGIAGIAYDTMGYLLYEDFKTGRDVTREGMVALQARMLKESQQTFGFASVQGGNLYMLSNADFLYDISDDGMGLSLLDESIPFYQLVVHGYLTYSSDMRNNLVSDYEFQLLRCVEYGSVPSFILTEQSSDLLVKTAANGIYTSEYAVWKERIVDFCTKYGAITDLQTTIMVDHAALGSNVYQTTYANGIKTVVNYSDAVYSWQGIEVSAKGYVVVDKDGRLLTRGEGKAS